MTYVFGPVPSRRLGRSLGINNIPPKICSYACVYCQLSKKTNISVDRQDFYSTADIVKSVKSRVALLRAQQEEVDYLAFVPDGEPTLDKNLGDTIAALKSLKIPVAVITNGSLMADPDVRKELSFADWVSVKVDTTDEKTWREINRPHGKLDLQSIHEGMLNFKEEYRGTLVSETMLIQGMNDTESEARGIASFLAKLKPRTAYLSIPTRPPSEISIKPAEPAQITTVFEIIVNQVEHVELLIGYEGNAFSFGKNVREDILNITAVHPMRYEAILELLAEANSNWAIIEEMLQAGELTKSEYANHIYYVRSF